jgi:cytidine deaminase
VSNFENPEDTKLATLATSTLTRTGAKQAAALRDTTGRTYVAINIESASLSLDALDAVFTVAMASQISGIEGVVVVGEKPSKVGAIRENSPDATVFYLDSSGEATVL